MAKKTAGTEPIGEIKLGKRGHPANGSFDRGSQTESEEICPIETRKPVKKPKAEGVRKVPTSVEPGVKTVKRL